MEFTLKLPNTKKGYSEEQDKVCAPDETIKLVKNRLIGIDYDILTKTVRIDSGRLDIPVFISLCGKDAVRIIGTQKQMGKGSIPEQAEASALMELVERYSFFSYVKGRKFKMASYDELGDTALPVEYLLISLHDTSTDLTLAKKVIKKIPFRWARAHNITRKKNEYVPFDWFYTINEYNGPAAGNTLDEAILQGLCEVIERHAGSLVSRKRLNTPTIDPKSITYPPAKELLLKYFKNGIKVFLKDFSLDTGIPTVAALAYDPTTFPEKSEIVFTAGTTTDPKKSVCRALTEVAQLAGDFEKATTYSPTLPKYGSLDEAQYLMNSTENLSVDQLPHLSSDTFTEDIYNCVDSLKRIGLEVLVVNVTHDYLEIPVIYCIIPGAHFRDRTINTDFAFHLAKVVSLSLHPERALQNLTLLDNAFGIRFDIKFFIGLCNERMGKTEEALSCYKRALETDPDPNEIASIYVHIGSCYKDLGEYKKAISFLEKAREHNPHLKEIYNILGFCFYKLKKHHKAIEQFEKAIEIDPGSAIDYANIASNFRELGYFREALHLYKMALELDPDIDFAHDNIKKLETALSQSE